MRVSVLGTGRMGKGLVNVLSPHVDRLLWGSRTVDKVQGIITERRYANVQAAGYGEALQADIIFHSFWFRDLIPWATANRDQLNGKIVVDLVNPFTDDFNDFTLDWGTSAAEELQRTIPEARVVGAFKNTFFKVLEEPIHHSLKSDVFVTGDDEEAKRAVMDVIRGTPFRIWDGGALKNNRTIERMTLLEREVAVRYGNYPYVSLRLFGMNE